MDLSIPATTGEGRPGGGSAQLSPVPSSWCRTASLSRSTTGGPLDVEARMGEAEVLEQVPLFLLFHQLAACVEGVTTSVCVCVSVRASAGRAFLCVSERDDVMCRAVCPCFVWVSVRVECVSVWVPTRQRAGPGDSFPPSFRAAVQAGLLYSLLLQNGMSFFTLHGTSSFLFC